MFRSGPGAAISLFSRPRTGNNGGVRLAVGFAARRRGDASRQFFVFAAGARQPGFCAALRLCRRSYCMDRIPTTREGFEKIRDEIRELEEVEMPKIAQKIA